MEENLEEPRLEEYGLNASSYENYINDREKLNISFKEYKKDLEDDSRKYWHEIKNSFSYKLCDWGILLIIPGVLGAIFSLISASWPQLLGFVGLFIIGNKCSNKTSSSDKDIKTREYSNFKKIEEKKKETDEKIQVLKNKIYPFEQASVNFYESYLKQFFENNLYKKRSGSEEFEQALANFSLMIDEVKEINKKLMFAHVNSIYSHESYLLGRQINHIFQKNNQFTSFDNIKIRTEEKPEQTKEISENLVLDPNKRIKEEFRKNVELKRIEEEKIEKERIRLMPPEKRFRTARKIDNWEEINRKRKETGDKGEQIVFVLEQEHFIDINRKDLADKVMHVSKDGAGVGLGYDILSFFDDGREKYIEVKSTTTHMVSPFKFNISSNELSFLEEHKEDAFIYIVSLATEPPEMETRVSSQVLVGEIIPVSFIVSVK